MTVRDLVRFVLTWGFPFTIYLAVQIFAIIRLRGYWLSLAVLPMPIMAYVVYVTMDAYREQSNLWPILLILSSPVSAIFLLVLVFAGRRPHP